MSPTHIPRRGKMLKESAELLLRNFEYLGTLRRKKPGIYQLKRDFLPFIKAHQLHLHVFKKGRPMNLYRYFGYEEDRHYYYVSYYIDCPLKIFYSKYFENTFIVNDAVLDFPPGGFEDEEVVGFVKLNLNREPRPGFQNVPMPLLIFAFYKYIREKSCGTEIKFWDTGQGMIPITIDEVKKAKGAWVTFYSFGADVLKGLNETNDESIEEHFNKMRDVIIERVWERIGKKPKLEKPKDPEKSLILFTYADDYGILTPKKKELMCSNPLNAPAVIFNDGVFGGCLDSCFSGSFFLPNDLLKEIFEENKLYTLNSLFTTYHIRKEEGRL